MTTGTGTNVTRLNLTHEHFSRTVHALIKSGLIEVEGRTIHVPALAHRP